MIHLIAALSKQTRAIGKNGDLLWHIPADLGRFKSLTIGHPVIMGRKTWESLPEKFRPLPGRTNIVVSRDTGYSASGATVVNTLEEAFEMAKGTEGADKIFVIGGGQLYEAALPYADQLDLTLINDPVEGDTFFPPYEEDFTRVISSEEREHEGLHFEWVELARSE
ncbi:MAG: dihydrofolate reductase [Bacillota bacterium]